MAYYNHEQMKAFCNAPVRIELHIGAYKTTVMENASIDAVMGVCRIVQIWKDLDDISQNPNFAVHIINEQTHQDIAVNYLVHS
jgi:hypothetical protein